MEIDEDDEGLRIVELSSRRMLLGLPRKVPELHEYSLSFDANECAQGEVNVTRGDPVEAEHVIDIFDRFDPQQALVVPPVSLVQDHP